MELKTLSVRGLQPRHANAASQHISDSQHRFTASFLQPLPQREDARQPGLECEHSRLNIYRRAQATGLLVFQRTNWRFLYVTTTKKNSQHVWLLFWGWPKKIEKRQQNAKKDRMLCRIVETGVRPTRKEDNYGLHTTWREPLEGTVQYSTTLMSTRRPGYRHIASFVAKPGQRRPLGTSYFWLLHLAFVGFAPFVCEKQVILKICSFLLTVIL